MLDDLKFHLKNMPNPLEIGKYITFLFSKMRLFGAESTVKLNGISSKFWTPSPVLYRRVKNFGWEKQLLKTFTNNIHPGDIIWDIGSFIGMYSIFPSHAAGSSGSVFAFEPDPTAHSYLSKNVQLNQIANITLFDFGLNDVNKEGYILTSKTHNAVSKSITYESGLSDTGTPVHLQSGDLLVQEKKALPPNLIKIDVEGAEARVLAGMKDILQRSSCRYLFMEVHPKLLGNFGNTIQDLHTIINEAGFTISKEIPRNTETHWICTKPGQQDGAGTFSDS